MAHLEMICKHDLWALGYVRTSMSHGTRQHFVQELKELSNPVQYDWWRLKLALNSFLT